MSMAKKKTKARFPQPRETPPVEAKLKAKILRAQLAEAEREPEPPTQAELLLEEPFSAEPEPDGAQAADQAVSPHADQSGEKPVSTDADGAQPSEVPTATAAAAAPQMVPRLGATGSPHVSPALRPTPSLVPPADSELDPEMTDKEKVRAANWLFLSQLCQSFCSNISQQSTYQMFLDHFAGDFAAHARLMTTLSSASAVAGFVLKPLFASATDKYGRRPLLALSPILQLAIKLCLCTCPQRLLIRFLMVQQMLMSFTHETSRIASHAAYGDLYSTDATQLGKMISREMITYPIVRPQSHSVCENLLVPHLLLPQTSIIGPLIGGALASRFGLRAPIAAAAAVFALQGIVVVPRVPETLRKSKRKAKLSIAGASPLSAVKLFTHGPVSATTLLPAFSIGLKTFTVLRLAEKDRWRTPLCTHGRTWRKPVRTGAAQHRLHAICAQLHRWARHCTLSSTWRPSCLLPLDPPVLFVSINCSKFIRCKSRDGTPRLAADTRATGACSAAPLTRSVLESFPIGGI